MLLVRTTQLEQFRKYQTYSPYVKESDLIDTLSGAFAGNNKTRIGTAGHRIVEEGMSATVKDHDNTLIVPIDYEYYARYNNEQCDTLNRHREALDGAFHELKHGQTYQTKHFPIHVGGTQDIIHGITVRDTKFVFRNPDPYNYWDSCQWRFYLDYLQLDVFYFDLFEFQGYKDDMKLNVSTLKLVPHEPLQCIRYKNMEQDNQKLVESFVDWLVAKELTHLLIQKEKYYE